MSLVKKVQKFFAYWYQRYLLATEMYMVEPWEKAVIHFIFLVLFSLFWWFNSSLVVSSIARLRNRSQMELVS
ncbi:uncharacterized protein [Choristoneura fumiferana]|uniref:uncharacterized protein n=1 Tax=Choristoneura fumiferana TaxID=7141 RepID=UPI003D1569A1